MKRCIIFCAGGFDRMALPAGAEDLIIAADGGLTHARAAGVTPGLVLGDFDSLGHIPAGAEVYPVEKDDTDAMLAVRRALALGYNRFELYGALDGDRVDHTMANFQLLSFLAEQGASGVLVGLRQCATVVRCGALRFDPACRGTVSVFSMGSQAEGVTLRGLYYPLEDGTLSGSVPLGVSNHFTGRSATIRVRQGTLLVIWDRQHSPAPFPEIIG